MIACYNRPLFFPEEPLFFKIRFSPTRALGTLFLIASLQGSFPNSIPAASVDGELTAPKVGAIRVEGLQADPPVESATDQEKEQKNEAKLSHVREKEVLDLMTLRPGDALSARRVREDIHLLFETGNFDDVQMFAESTKKKDEILLVVRVKERARVGRLTLEGNEKKKDRKIKEAMKTTMGKPLDPSQLLQDLDEIRKLYREDGYNDVAVDAQTQASEKGDRVDVTITVQEGVQVKVGLITLEGVQSFSEKKVRGQLKELKEGKKFRPDHLEEERKRLEGYYRNEGYLRCVVGDAQITPAADGRTVDIRFQVREGVAYHLGQLTVEGAFVIPPEDILKVARLEKDKLLRQKDLDDARERIRSLYLDRGYIYCRVDPRIDTNDETLVADVQVNLDEGEVAYIQDIRITGNYKTRDYVIRRELIMKPGEKFEVAKIRASTMGLYNLGFFEEVNPDMEPGDKPGQAVLVFRIKERKTGSIGLGGGYSSVDKWVGNLKFEEANLFGRGQRLNIDWEFGKTTNSFNIGFTEPWLFNTKTSGTVSLFNTIHSMDAYTERRTGGSLGLGRRLTRRLSVYNSYLYERVKLYDIGLAYQDPLSPTYIPVSTNRTSSMTPRVVYDNRDNVFDAKRGWRHSLSCEVAGGLLGADNNFIKLQEDTSKFLPLFWKFVIGEHVRLGFARGYRARGHFTDVPIYERFYCGGADTVRGYDERTIGPSRGVAGGKVLYVLNSELKYPIAGPLRGVFFYDVGGLWSDLKYVQNDLEYGYGLGVRLTIPGTVMSIRVDYGWPLNSTLPDADKRGKLHFNLGDIF